MSDAKAMRQRGTGHMEVAKQGRMAGHKRLKGPLDGDEALSDGGRVARVLAIKR